MNIKRSKLKKNSKNKEKYFFGGIDPISMGITSGMNMLNTGIQSIGNDSLKTGQKVGKTLLSGVPILGDTLSGLIQSKPDQSIINKQIRDERMAQGNLYSKHGGNTDPEYLGVLDPNKLEKISDRLSKIKGPSHPDGGTAMTRNGKKKSFEAEGNEIIDNKTNYMFSNKTRKDLKLDKKFKSGGDLIDKKTEDWNIKQATKYNDKTLKKEGLFNRTSQIKSGGCPPGYDCGGKMKYLPGGTLGALPLTKWDSKDVLNNLNTASSSNPADITSFGQNAGLNYIGPTSTPNTSGVITNNFDNNLRFNKGTGSAFPNINQKLHFTKTGPTLSAPSNKEIANANKVGSISATNSTKPSKVGLSKGEWAAMGAGAFDSASQLGMAWKNKPHKVNYDDISAKYDRDTSKALSGIDWSEGETIKDVYGATNKALDQTSYPSYQVKQSLARNILSGVRGDIAKTRGEFANMRANARIGVAGQSADLRFKTRSTKDLINTQEEDAFHQGKADALKNTANAMYTTANTLNANQYRKDFLNSGKFSYYDGNMYNLGIPEDATTASVKYRRKLGGSIKKSIKRK